MQKTQKNIQTIITTVKNSTISAYDRGLNYGDGFFTTAKVVNGQVEHWSHHKARLIECAARLGFPLVDIEETLFNLNDKARLYDIEWLKDL